MYHQIKKFLALSLSAVVFIMLINIKMPTIVGILIFMSMINFVLSWVEYEKSFITSGTGLLLFSSEIRLPCRKPIDITNGSYTVWGNNMLLEYTCDAGLFALGRTFGSCNPVTRRWSIKPIKCVGKLSMLSPNYTNNTTKLMCTCFKNFSWLSITRFRKTWNNIVIHLINW